MLIHAVSDIIEIRIAISKHSIQYQILGQRKTDGMQKKLTVLMSNDANSFLIGTVALNLSRFDDVPRPHREK